MACPAERSKLTPRRMPLCLCAVIGVGEPGLGGIGVRSAPAGIHVTLLVDWTGRESSTLGFARKNVVVGRSIHDTRCRVGVGTGLMQITQQ